MAKIIKVGTRTSKLAMAQTKLVLDAINAKFPEIEFEIVSIKTKGDQHHHSPLRDVFEEGKGAFTSELQQALKKKKIDIAVHSMKDVAGNVREAKLTFGAFLKRSSPADVLILKTDKYKTIRELPIGYVVGTVSARRKAAMMRNNSAIFCKNLRGNVQTRVAKLRDTHIWETHKKIHYDAIVMAKSAIERSGDDLDLSGLSYFELPIKEMLPAAGQGTIGVECRKKDKKMLKVLKEINHRETELVTIAEREFLYELGGNCHTVIGVYATIENGNIHISADISEESGINLYTIENSGSIEQPEELGIETARKLKENIVKAKSERFLYEKLNLSKK